VVPRLRPATERNTVKITVSIDVTVTRANFSETTVNEIVTFDHGDNPRFEWESINASLIGAYDRVLPRFPREDTSQ
jgi:hypothetical protein